MNDQLTGHRWWQRAHTPPFQVAELSVTGQCTRQHTKHHLGGAGLHHKRCQFATSSILQQGVGKVARHHLNLPFGQRLSASGLGCQGFPVEHNAFRLEETQFMRQQQGQITERCRLLHADGHMHVGRWFEYALCIQARLHTHQCSGHTQLHAALQQGAPV